MTTNSPAPGAGARILDEATLEGLGQTLLNEILRSAALPPTAPGAAAAARPRDEKPVEAPAPKPAPPPTAPYPNAEFVVPREAAGAPPELWSLAQTWDPFMVFNEACAVPERDAAPSPVLPAFVPEMASGGSYYFLEPASPTAELPEYGPSFDVEAVRRDFPILHKPVDGKPLVYLDNAATT